MGSLGAVKMEKRPSAWANQCDMGWFFCFELLQPLWQKQGSQLHGAPVKGGTKAMVVQTMLPLSSNGPCSLLGSCEL